MSSSYRACNFNTPFAAENKLCIISTTAWTSSQSHRQTHRVYSTTEYSVIHRPVCVIWGSSTRHQMYLQDKNNRWWSFSVCTKCEWRDGVFLTASLSSSLHVLSLLVTTESAERQLLLLRAVRLLKRHLSEYPIVFSCRSLRRWPADILSVETKDVSAGC